MNKYLGSHFSWYHTLHHYTTRGSYGAEYLHHRNKLKGLPWYLFIWFNFYGRIFVRWCFLVLMFKSLISSFIFLCLIESSNLAMLFSFFPTVLMRSRFGCSIRSVFSQFTFFIIRMVHFSIGNPIPKPWLYILIIWVIACNIF